jgi:hypothetical protein
MDMAKANDYMLKEDRDLLATRREKWRVKWQKTRKHGEALYVTIETLKFGALLFTFDLLWDFLIDRKQFHRDLDIGSLVGFAVVMVLVISLMEVWEWHRNEKRFKKQD